MRGKWLMEQSDVYIGETERCSERRCSTNAPDERIRRIPKKKSARENKRNGCKSQA